MSGCKFDRAWIGPCGKPTVEGSDYCEEHNGRKCSNEGCDNQAISECDAQIISLVCGAPYCAECGRHYRCYPPEHLKPKVGDYCTKHGKKVVEIKYGRVPYCPECYIDDYVRKCELSGYTETYEEVRTGYQIDPTVDYLTSECRKYIHRLNKFCPHCGRLLVAPAKP